MNNINTPQISEPTMKKRLHISPLWIFTLIAFLLAGGLLYKSINDSGQQIEIYFKDAQGIEAGRTTIRYQGLEVGMVRQITLSDDLKSIYAQVDIYPEAKKILLKNTVFWIVRPKATLTGITGLDTLVTGNYIAVQPGDGPIETTFVASDEAPKESFNDHSLHLQLKTPDLGAINIGSGVYYKKVRVGEVYDYQLDPLENNITVSFKIQKEHASLVMKESRFWNVSGVNAQFGLSGVSVNIENLTSLIAGGIAFDSPLKGIPAKHLETYTLYPSINETERGQKIRIKLPDNHGIKNTEAPILFQGLEVGRLNGIHFSPSYSGTFADANIDPSMRWALTSGTEFVIEKPEFNLSGVKNISNMLFGNSLSLQPGKGQVSYEFTAKTTQNILADNPDSLTVHLSAEDAWGIDKNTRVIYRGLEVGFVHKTSLKNNEVALELVILSEYKHLVKTQSLFYILGGISAQMNSDGVEVIVPSMTQIADPAITFSSEGKQKVNPSYVLFKSQIHAQNAKISSIGSKKITLIANKLPSISEGSPVMYKNFTVGKVKNFKLVKNHVEVSIEIDKHYQHLLTKNSVFWDHSGIDIKANLSGVEINTASFKSILKGGLSFDEMKGIENKIGQNWKLYESLTAAQNYGLEIDFEAQDANGLSKGSAIRYQGVDVGEIMQITPDFQHDGIRVKAIIYPEYSDHVVKKDSYFWITQPHFSLTKMENLDSLFVGYVSVAPGKGKSHRNFKLHKSEEFPGGLSLVLESENLDSVTVGTPLFFRDFEVGAVTNVRLGRFADRVLLEIKISDDYKHLVRENTLFWNHSGVDVSIGLTGATIKSGTIESIVRGGIAFATPEGAKLEKIANSGRHFLLHKTSKPEWVKWKTAIPAF